MSQPDLGGGGGRVNAKKNPRNLRGLPKVHKNKLINGTCITSAKYVNIPTSTDVKLRPIIAGPTCEIHRSSNFIDKLMKPLVKHIRGFIRDNLDFVNHLPSEVNTYIVSLDVSNLHRNIP